MSDSVLAERERVRHPAPAELPPRRRQAVLLLPAIALLALTALASVSLGSRMLPPGEVLGALFSTDTSEASTIVQSLRLPRTLLGILVGTALAVAGVLIQSLTRNPIADPGLLGITHGAACAVVASIYLAGLASVSQYVWLAIAGSLLVSMAVFALASGGTRGPTPVTLVLAGAAMTALMYGLTSAIVLLDKQSLEVYRFWRIGSLAARPADVIWQVLPFLLIGLVLAAALTRSMNTLALGDDVATALGQRIRLIRATGVLAVALLTGGAVAAAGPIGFIGLMTPHIARAVTGPDHRWLTVYAAFIGAVVILLADIAGRLVTSSGEIEVGIILAVLGAPFFIMLIRRQKLISL
ncbi:iron complex transport system permease protein [Haloactinospora alba]|uniref:Iron complex transport system permease protein n=1 Tax=Haloactinospora alba TaxID=405555 RepID=A0A543NGY3_9ACTN|nr:iron ABC transporter permease [Haloactinospora alba]TQN31116.1 iron complex transport system permease protein [Haloactinospora alba]